MSQGAKRVVYWAIGANVAIAVAKFVAASITGSSAMASEGIHSLIDTVDGVLLLVGAQRASRPPDDEHPYGHGRELYFWSFVVAVLIFALGGGISLFDGIQRLRFPEPIKNPLASYIVLGLAFLFEGTTFVISVRHLRRTVATSGYRSLLRAIHGSKDPADFMIVFEDGAALAGLLIAAGGVTLQILTGRTWFDGAASILIGLLLAAAAVFVAIETRSLLIGEGLTEDMKREIRGILESESAVTHSDEPLGTYLGPRTVILNVSVTFRNELTMAELREAMTRIESALRSRFPVVRHVFFAAHGFHRSP